MAASISDYFNNATETTRPDPAALTAQKLIGAASITVDTTAGWATGTAVHLTIYQVDASGSKVANTQTDWKGIVTSGTTIGTLTLKAGTDAVYPVGSKVICAPTGAWADDMITGLLVEHNQDGTHGDITATTVTADEFIVTGSASANNGWEVGLPAPNTVTNNGNRSYDLVFNSNDLTDTVSEGMRLRTTRTVSAPTQCADLESGSSQYFSKTSPAGISFTTTFTCAAWIKAESYGVGGIICRRNGSTEGWSLTLSASGQITVAGLRVAGNEKFCTTYQSIPLNKWVHVAACLDMTVGDTTAQKIWIDGVEVPRLYTLTGTATALVQGTTALVVGAARSDGTSPFDGKIAQASVHSACLSTAQIQAMMSQTIDSSSPSIVSGFTLNNDLEDVSANNNDLTASGGALATATDTPFGNGLGLTLDYAIITKTAFSTNTTLTVQVPEGCTIPTGGGVSAVAYSTQDTPYGFPRSKNRWLVESINMSIPGQSAPVTGTWYNIGSFYVTVPIGAWTGSFQAAVYGEASATSVQIDTALSTSSSTWSDSTMIAGMFLNTSTSHIQTHHLSRDYTLSAQTPFYLVHKKVGGTLLNIYLYSASSVAKLSFCPAYL